MNDHKGYEDQEGARHQKSPVIQSSEQSEEELDLRELLLKLNRRRKAIAGIFILVVVVTGLYLYQATPRYTAQTQLTLDIRKSNVVNVEEVLSGLSADASVIGTELDIIRSSTLLSRVADKLNLQNDPEFNPALLEDEPGWAEQLADWIKGLWFMEAEPQEELTPEEQKALLRQSIVKKLRDNLEVEHRRQSHTITISYTSESAERAAQVANTLAELYLTDQLEAKFEASRLANEWLSERLDSLRQEVQAAEQAVVNVREQKNLIQAGGATILEQQIGDVNAQLVQARVKTSRAEAKLSRAREILNQPGGIEGLSEVLDSRTIQQLRSEETSLRRKKAELGERYGSRHPQMLQIEAEMKDLQNKINEEVKRILESLENELQTAKAEQRSLQRSFNELRIQAGTAMEAEMELRELERRAESSRGLYQDFLNRFQETREQDALQRPDARIISPAEKPASPAYPRKKMTLGLGMMAGLMFGVMGAFLLETLDRGYRTSDQVEKDTGLPLLGTIPSISRAKGDPEQYVLKKPHSALAEDLRALRTAIHLSNVDHPPKTILVTSSVPMEGKSTLCLSMGRVAALSGARVLIVEADLRRPTLLKKVAQESEPEFKLEDILQEKAEVKQAIVVEKQSGLHLLPAHGKTTSSSDLLGSRRMAKLIQNLTRVYDLVIIDTPPVMGVSDAWGLARAVDSVVYVIRWSETPRELVRSALRQMKNLGIRVNGAVLTRINVRQQARYGYGGYGYYYGKYKKYYQD